MRNFRRSFAGGNNSDSVVGQLSALIEDEARVAELSEFGTQLAGMFLANLTGGTLSALMKKVAKSLKLEESAWMNTNLVSALLGGVLAWKAPDFLRMLGFNDLATDFEGKSMLGNLRHGATLLFGLSFGVQALGYAGKKLNISIPGFSGESVLNTLTKDIKNVTTAGVGLLDIWGGGDYQTKIDDFKRQADELTTKVN
jgi:hypothetical protein